MVGRFVEFVGEKREYNATGYRDELDDTPLWVVQQLVVIGAAMGGGDGRVEQGLTA